MEEVISKNKMIKEQPKKTLELSNVQKYILFFFIYAFLGWLLETLYSFYSLGHFTKRGFLYGPLCPIYGYGALILTIFLSNYRKNSIKLFFLSAIVFSVFEYIVSYALDALFAKSWWDYTNEFMNLNGRISIFYTFAWGIIAILFINHIHPFLKKKVELILSKIPYFIQTIIIRCMVAIFLADTILSCIKYLI